VEALSGERLRGKRQVWCLLQVKLCDPCLSALKWFVYHARRYTSAFFTFYPYANFGISTLKGAVLHMREIVIICVYFLPPPLPLLFYFLRLYKSHHLTDFCVLCLKRHVSATAMPFLGCKQKISIFSTIFHKNTRNSLFPQCKTSIGNNSGFIKDRAVKFAYRRGFLAIEDRWCDCHLCHVTGSDHTHLFSAEQHLESGSIQARTVDKMCIICISLATRMGNIIFSIIFHKKICEISYSYSAKKSIGNNCNCNCNCNCS